MKIDMSEVNRLKATLKSSIKVMRSQVEATRDRLHQVAASHSLKGKVKEAIDQKITHHQIPLLINYLTALHVMASDYEALTRTFKEEVDKSADAIINTDYLSSLKGVFPGIEQGLSHIQRNSQSIYSSISDIIDLEAPSSKDVLEELRGAKQVLTDTNERLAAFQALKPSSSFSDILAAQDRELQALSRVQRVSYNSSEASKLYGSREFSVRVAQTTELGRDSYQVDLQNHLAGELVASRYSGKSFHAYPTRYKLDAKTKALIERANKGDAEAIRILASQSKGYQEAVGSAGRKLSSGERKYRNEQVWRETLTSGKHLLCEVLPIYDSYRLVTGKDPVTGKKASRLEAGFWLGLEALPYVSKIAKTRKAAKTAKVAEKAEDVARAVDKVEDGVRLSEKTLNATARFDEHSIVKYTDKMTGNYTAKDVEALTQLTTHNANSKTALLGYFEESSVRSYEQIAHANGFTYFDAGTDGWKAMSKVDGELAPKVNKEFLVQQIKEGKDFVLTSNPYKARQYFIDSMGKGESFMNEMNILRDNGYKFEKYGKFWRAYK